MLYVQCVVENGFVCIRIGIGTFGVRYETNKAEVVIRQEFDKNGQDTGLPDILFVPTKKWMKAHVWN